MLRITNNFLEHTVYHCISVMKKNKVLHTNGNCGILDNKI